MNNNKYKIIIVILLVIIMALISILFKKGVNNYSIGEEVCLSTECFHVISETSKTVTLLAKYNLNVGNQPYGEATGIQNSKCLGTTNEGKKYAKGPVKFCDSTYWADKTSGDLLEAYVGKSELDKYTYPLYIYDENSEIYQYVESYIQYLNDQGYKINEGRLLSVSELFELANCGELNYSVHECNMSTTTDRSWLYTSSYWLGSALNGSPGTNIWRVDFSGRLSGRGFDLDENFGVRPVIVLSKSQIK